MDRARTKQTEDFELPILLYYGSGRLWDIHRNIETEKPGSRLDAYRFCLDPMSDQKAFEKWFKKLSQAEIQKKQTYPPIEVVREAVLRCIPGGKTFYHDMDADQIVIGLDDESLMPFDRLSDGYRNMVAMVADIAHRASRLNPHLEKDAAIKAQGIVLIDEIDLHLHPKWQRVVVRDLRAAFPGIQFIVTTHSPFIIQSLDPGEVIDLDRSATPISPAPSEEIAFPGPLDAYSNRSIEDIVEDIMGVAVPQRSQHFQAMFDAAKEYYGILQKIGTVDEVEKASLKGKLDELSARYSDNVAYHAFLEMERMATEGDLAKRESEKCAPCRQAHV